MNDDAAVTLSNLIVNARGGNEQALNELLAKYRPYLRLIAEQAVGPGLRRREDASDLVQQAQLEVFRAIDGFRGTDEAEFTAWIRAILRNKVSNAVRDHRADKRDLRREKALVQQNGSAMLSWFGPAGGEQSPSGHVIHAETALNLAAALEQLPEDQSIAVRLRHLEGMKLTEIAREMERTPDAVAGLVRRGVAALKQHLTPSEASSLGN